MEKSLPGGKLPFVIFLLGPAKLALRMEAGGARPLQATPGWVTEVLFCGLVLARALRSRHRKEAPVFFHGLRYCQIGFLGV
jgi:hypothetical protein